MGLLEFIQQVPINLAYTNRPRMFYLFFLHSDIQLDSDHSNMSHIPSLFLLRILSVVPSVAILSVTTSRWLPLSRVFF